MAYLRVSETAELLLFEGQVAEQILQHAHGTGPSAHHTTHGDSSKVNDTQNKNRKHPPIVKTD